MSMFEDERYRWRETYFVLFDARKRPTLDRMKRALEATSSRFALANLGADEQGQFESVTVLSPDDFAAMDIVYVEGEEVVEQVGELTKEMKFTICDAADEAKLKRIRHCDGRFDVLHFEEVTQPGDEDELGDEMLDPGAILLVLGTLAKLTGGVAIDPQSGTVI
jgi:hypothetical protein